MPDYKNAPLSINTLDFVIVENAVQSMDFDIILSDFQSCSWRGQARNGLHKGKSAMFFFHLNSLRFALRCSPEHLFFVYLLIYLSHTTL